MSLPLEGFEYLEDALKLQFSEMFRPRAEHALAAIRSVHWDGTIRPRVIANDANLSRTRDGCYDQGQNSLWISPEGPYPESTFIHEVAHVLDSLAISGRSSCTVFGRSLEGWRGAVVFKRSYAWLKHLEESATVRLYGCGRWVGQAKTSDTQDHVEYLLDWGELSARPYYQWVAIMSDDRLLLRQLNRIRGDLDGITVNCQWAAEDFEEVSRSLDGVFEAMQYM